MLIMYTSGIHELMMTSASKKCDMATDLKREELESFPSLHEEIGTSCAGRAGSGDMNSTKILLSASFAPPKLGWKLVVPSLHPLSELRLTS